MSEKIGIERVWGQATVSGGGHVVKVKKGVIHMVPCELPAAAVRLTVRSSLGGAASVMLTVEEAQEVVKHLTGVAYDA